MDSSLLRLTRRPSLWPGLWIPATILLAGLIATVLMASVESKKARDLAEARYHYQHQTLVNLLLARTPAQMPPANTTEWLQALFSEVLPPSLGLRIDTLERHSKQPLFQVRTNGHIDPTRALRTEISPGGTLNWMLTTVPDPAILDRKATQAKAMVWTGGLIISGFATLLAVLLCRRLHRQSIVLATLAGKESSARAQVTNLQVEKAVLRQALNDSEERSRDLVALSGAITCELDKDGCIGYISAQVANLIGRAPSDLSGQAFLELIGTEYRENYLRALDSARTDGTMARIDLSLKHDHEDRATPVILRILARQDPLHGLIGYRLSALPLS